MLRKHRFDFFTIPIRERPRQRPHIIFHLLHRAAPDEYDTHGRVLQDPPQRQLWNLFMVFFSDQLQLFNNTDVTMEILLRTCTRVSQKHYCATKCTSKVDKKASNSGNDAGLV